jgi:hypothetical protein
MKNISNFAYHERWRFYILKLYANDPDHIMKRVIIFRYGLHVLWLRNYYCNKILKKLSPIWVNAMKQNHFVIAASLLAALDIPAFYFGEASLLFNKILLESSSWLQIQRSGFDSRRHQIFWEALGPERGPLSLVSTIQELLGRKSSGSGLETENTAVGISHTDHMAPSISKDWH